MDKSTDINDLPFKSGQPNIPGQQPQNPMAAMGQAPPKPINTSPDAVQHRLPAEQQNIPVLPQGMMQARQQVGPQVGGPGQGMNSPDKVISGKKEFFGLKETDYKSTVVVFALILIFSSSFFFEMLRNYLPAVM